MGKLILLQISIVNSILLWFLINYIDVDLSQALILKIIDEFFLRNNIEPFTNEKKIKSSKTISTSDTSRINFENELNPNQNTIIKRILAKNPAFMINFFNLHTIKNLFITILERTECKAKINSIKDNKTLNYKNKNSSDDINDIWDELSSIFYKYNFCQKFFILFTFLKNY